MPDLTPVFWFLLQLPQPAADLSTLVGPLVGAGAGTYFGLKAAINGVRADVRDIRGEVRATKELLIRHVAVASTAIQQVAAIHKELT